EGAKRHRQLVAEPGRVGGQGGPKHRQCRLVFLRSHHPRICPRYLERPDALGFVETCQSLGRRAIPTWKRSSAAGTAILSRCSGFIRWAATGSPALSCRAPKPLKL